MTPPEPTKAEMKEALKRLQKASDLIAKEEAWCVNHYALDGNKKVVPPTSQDAKCFCSYGALMQVNPPFKEDEILWQTCYSWVLKALQEIVPDDNEPSLQVYNDNHTHTEIITLFARAKEIAKEEIKKA